ncbi:MAG: endonuclease/exonuclease/phosphatase family protein [Myxococcota bacterium]|nr:endonuclease/exonuclease/phosphatase family protein [Myxococcota bacterium]
MKIALLTTTLTVLSFVLLFFWMAGGIQLPKRIPLEPKTFESLNDHGTSSSSTSISVLSWNIAWAYGQGSEGSGPSKSRQDLQKNLVEIADHIKHMNADVVLLQEIDFDSDRTYNLDQAEFIAKNAGYKYYIRGISWSANYLPFPYWPPSEHWGQMLSGGAILSKLPVRSADVALLPKPSAQSFFYRQFYLFRYLMRCELSWQGKKLSILNTHLEAFDQENREIQMKLVSQAINEDPTSIHIFGGDFNSVPREAQLRHGYPDEPETDHRNDKTLEILLSTTQLAEAAAAVTKLSIEDRFTFPASAPNRQLDHLFISPQLEVLNFQVSIKSTLASDHLPIFGRFKLRENH